MKVWCPNCISFGWECDVDTEEYSEPCSYYKEVNNETTDKGDKEKVT